MSYLESYVENHRKLWNKMAEILENEEKFGPFYIVGKLKNEAARELNMDIENIDGGCWLCEYDKKFGYDNCKFCPLAIRGGMHCLDDLYGVFCSHLHSRSEETIEIAKIAKKIANLPIINRRGEKREKIVAQNS